MQKKVKNICVCQKKVVILHDFFRGIDRINGRVYTYCAVDEWVTYTGCQFALWSK